MASLEELKHFFSEDTQTLLARSPEEAALGRQDPRVLRDPSGSLGR